MVTKVEFNLCIANELRRWRSEYAKPTRGGHRPSADEYLSMFAEAMQVNVAHILNMMGVNTEYTHTIRCLPVQFVRWQIARKALGLQGTFSELNVKLIEDVTRQSFIDLSNG